MSLRSRSVTLRLQLYSHIISPRSWQRSRCPLQLPPFPRAHRARPHARSLARRLVRFLHRIRLLASRRQRHQRLAPQSWTVGRGHSRIQHEGYRSLQPSRRVLQLARPRTTCAHQLRQLIVPFARVDGSRFCPSSFATSSLRCRRVQHGSSHQECARSHHLERPQAADLHCCRSSQQGRPNVGDPRGRQRGDGCRPRIAQGLRFVASFHFVRCQGGGRV